MIGDLMASYCHEVAKEQIASERLPWLSVLYRKRPHVRVELREIASERFTLVKSVLFEYTHSEKLHSG